MQGYFCRETANAGGQRGCLRDWNVSFLSDGIISKAGGRREVLSSLNFYTTQIRRITKRYLAFAVSMGDIL